MMTKEKFMVEFENLQDEWAVILHNEYCNSEGCEDDLIMSTDDFDDYYESCTPTDIVLAVRYGDYNPNDYWFQFNGYGNPVSSNNPVSDFMDIDAIGEWAYENEIDLSAYGIDIDIYDDEDEDDEE